MVQSARLLGDSDPLVTATDINGRISSTLTLTKHRIEKFQGRRNILIQMMFYIIHSINLPSFIYKHTINISINIFLLLISHLCAG